MEAMRRLYARLKLRIKEVVEPVTPRPYADSRAPAAPCVSRNLDLLNHFVGAQKKERFRNF
jgi:hypothetical protein